MIQYIYVYVYNTETGERNNIKQRGTDQLWSYWQARWHGVGRRTVYQCLRNSMSDVQLLLVQRCGFARCRRALCSAFVPQRHGRAPPPARARLTTAKSGNPQQMAIASRLCIHACPASPISIIVGTGFSVHLCLVRCVTASWA